MRTRSLAAALALGFALTVAGCGGDDSSGSDTTAPSGGAVDTAVDTTVGGTDTTAGSESSDTTATFSGSENSAFCKKARDLEESQQALDVLGSGTNPSPEELKKQFEEAGRALEELGEDVPSEIRKDYEAFLKGWKEFTDFFGKYDYDFAKLMTAAAEDPSLLESGPFANFSDENNEFAQSAERIGQYIEQVCGISSGG